MDREEKIEVFFQGKKSGAGTEQGVRLKEERGHSWVVALTLVVALGLFAYILRDSLIAVVVISSLILLTLSVAIIGRLTRPKLWLYRERLVYRKSRKKELSFNYSDIKYIFVNRKRSENGAPCWTFHLKSGGEVAIAPSFSADDGELSTFFRGAFQPLIWDQGDTEEHPNSLISNLMRLFALVIKSDGDLSEKGQDMAVDYFWKNFYVSQPEHKTTVKERFGNYMKNRQVDYKVYCERINKCGKLNYWARYDVVDALFECAYVSEGVNKVELQVLREIANSLKIRPWHITTIENDYECQKHDAGIDTGNFLLSCEARKSQALSVLGLPESSSLSDVKHVYRQMVMNCHPDKLPKDATMAEKEEAYVRFRSVTEAYEYLCETL